MNSLEHLLDCWEEGELSAEALGQFEAVLATTAGRAAFFRESFDRSVIAEVLKAQACAVAEASSRSSIATPRKSSASVSRHTVAVLLSGIIAAAVLFVVGLFVSQGQKPGVPLARPPQVAVADLPEYNDADDFDLPIEMVAEFAEFTSTAGGNSRDVIQRRLSPTTLNVTSGAAQFASLGGADVRLEGPALFGLSSGISGVLFEGSVQARLTKPDANYSVLISNLKVFDLGTEFRVRAVDNDHVEVEVLDGEVEIQSRSRLPLFFWDFEESNGRFADAVLQQPATLQGSARRVGGIVGSGAVEFDNSPGSMVRIEGGTGEKVGTGRFACSSGISIEAMIVSRWSGQWEDYDEIFRKNDGAYRMLLAFQHDYSRKTMPPIPSGPCLTLGLHLEGHRFGRLAMPLDGRDGRPSLEELTDGRPHHIVATYDAFSGLKALYIDGWVRYQHRYPVGTLILSGGPEGAVIGDASENPHFDKSAFNGQIDEVAFYDFALTPDEVAEHYRHVMAGANYFGDDVEQLRAPPWKGVTRLVKGDRVVFDRHRVVPVGAVRSPRR